MPGPGPCGQLTAPEARGVCERMDHDSQRRSWQRAADEAAKAGPHHRFPVVMKIVRRRSGTRPSRRSHRLLSIGGHAKEASPPSSPTPAVMTPRRNNWCAEAKMFIGGHNHHRAVTDPRSATGALVLGGHPLKFSMTFPSAGPGRLERWTHYRCLDLLQRRRSCSASAVQEPVDRAALSSMIERVLIIGIRLPNFGDGFESPVFAARPRLHRGGCAHRLNFQSRPGARSAIQSPSSRN